MDKVYNTYILSNIYRIATNFSHDQCLNENTRKRYCQVCSLVVYATV